MMKFLSFLFVFILFAFALVSYMNRDEPLSEGARVANKIIDKTADELEAKYGIYTIGTGMSAYDMVRELYLSFQINKSLDKKEARKLLVNCAQTFLKNINDSGEIRPHLYISPFTSKNIRVKVFFQNPDGGDIYYPAICVVSLLDGKVYFRTEDKENILQYKTEEVESFEEALGIVKNNR